MQEGDYVHPSKTNPVRFKEDANFPWRVHRVKGSDVWLTRKTKSGKIRNEIWFIGFWEVVAQKETELC